MFRIQGKREKEKEKAGESAREIERERERDQKILDNFRHKSDVTSLS